MLRRSLLVLLLVASPLLGQAASQLPTVEQMQAQLDTNPQAVLQGVARALALKGPAAAQYDRYELLSLRGEARLRAKAMPPAAEAFAAAAKETTDPAKKTTARANEILIKKSKANGYMPKPPRANAAPSSRPAVTGPIPIIKPEDRKLAMEALFNDELAIVEPKLKAADNAQALPPIIEAVKVLGDLNALEKTGTGQDAQTKQLSTNMGKRAHAMINSSLDQMSKRTEDIWNSASQRSTRSDNVGNTYSNPGMVGMNSVDQKDLKNIVAMAEKIAPVASDLATVTAAPELIADATTAQRLLTRAQEVLNYDYPNSGRYNKTPQGTQQQQPPGTPPRKY